ncbi:FOG: TPR repeat SEL1 subfamily protein-like protein [Methylocella silvestris BL2]|uniref:FOG: TPR repeat SEL1 subfamily protein-like protein n=1 Tax=Methylocella silvestris (strain DSM 15510 / CIP 108128 / LMG 27833 / NCIMB 13906 / BL2) TaxID=395965 RepID=B8ENL2_METSB|nr:FOG: TPR repeat SEL1 subfamily protein-like protein [Methylocella silvestris BL2]
MSFFRDVDLTSIVNQYQQHSNLSRSELTQKICDEAATLAHSNSHDQSLYFAVSDAIAERNFFNFRPPASLHFESAETNWAPAAGQLESGRLGQSDNREFLVWKEEIKNELVADKTSRGLLALGRLHYDEGDYARAFQYFLEAAKRDNSPIAYLELGFLHSPGGFKYGEGNQGENLKYAFQCFDYAARNGVVESYFPLAMAYWRGDGVAKDEVKAFEWMNKAHLAGSPYAKTFLAECLVDGKLNVTKNPDLAHQLIFNEALPALEKAGSDAFLARACYAAGYVRELGFSDIAGAVGLYERAVGLGFSGADIYFRLFVIYKDVLKPSNATRALHFLRLAADQNNPHALYNLAKFHLDGTIQRGNEQAALDFLIRHSKIQYADDCAKRPGLERGLANYLLGTLLQQMR